MKDYRTIESELRTIADEFSKSSAINSPFKGNNFMTNCIAASRKHKSGMWLELSYGRGMSDNWIFGVTFADFDGNDYHEASGCCHDMDEVREKINSALA